MRRRASAAGPASAGPRADPCAGPCAEAAIWLAKAGASPCLAGRNDQAGQCRLA